MTGISSLLIPILLSSVIVFVASSVLHMMIPWHRSDYPKVPNEDQLRDAIRPLGIPPGDYMVPRPAAREEMRSPEFMEKIRQGPNLIMTVLPAGPWGMARQLVMWFIYIVVVTVFSAYIAGRALPPASPFAEIFRFVCTTAFLAYAAGLWQTSIWYRRAWMTTIKSTVDGLIYGALTAATFGWLWPK
ncbi:MAG TPA: hypothetical protein VIF83_01550 [Gemmatimonadaceae bacterium]|jgi:hypothetical protein